MKKVRMAIGTAVPAAGLVVMPAATAHAATSQQHPDPAARVEQMLRHAKPAATCGLAHSALGISPRGEFAGGIGYDGNCVRFQTGDLTHDQTGLTERVRYWTSGKMTRQDFLGGHISGGSTLWASYPNYYATEVCQALVANGNHNDVLYGPVCEYTS